ncbi:hypothetical protein QBC37DRAFT_325810 [Rhypophila decipiens]|uniref:N-acetyltransferase domain-containing protein n=1 Tax=Rhypophila decipiens TaxID=261697 RepID=A0AAN7B2E4_9PEZI|nr:hypothetical protein QBC37DRAFT_325810 [Rhypophila decipiens]
MKSTEMMAAAPKPRIRIREATRADADAMADIQLAAFGTDVIDQLLYPGEITEDARVKAAHLLFAPPHDHEKQSSEETLRVVAELDLESNGPVDGRQEREIIAFAKWTLRHQAVPEEGEEEHHVSADELGEGSNIEVYRWFHETMHRKLSELTRGDAFLGLDVLVCAPHRQRLGAGSALVRWGTDLADRLELVSWVGGSSPYGYPLYKRHGYQDIDVVDFKVTERWGVTRPEDRDWGENCAVDLGGPLGVGELRSVFMKRVPLGPLGASR